MAHGFRRGPLLRLGINGEPTNKKSGQWRDRPLSKSYRGYHEAEEVAAAGPAGWRFVWLRTGRSNWQVGSGAINSEPKLGYGNRCAGAIERWVHSRRY
jgi:hypothetical protein